MEIVKGRYGECRFCDNMDPEFGLPSLEDKSWDLCLTDYPYNVSFEGKSFGGLKYNDSKSFEDYLFFCQNIFAEIQRVSKGQIIFCGNPNINMWIKYIAEPKGIGVHYKPNCQSRGKGYYCLKHELFLIYGDVLLGKSVYKYNTEYQTVENHPCPNNPELYAKLISDTKAESILDVFMGSGTTACSSIMLGKKWLGYEIMEAYKPDIEKRIKRGIEKSKQTNLEAFFQ
jgi:DNA modification methylase